MATLLLSAAGAAIGGSFGGTFGGLAAGAVGKAIGATVGAVIDQRLTGLGSETVEAGRVERFQVMGASEGAALPRVFGRVRTAGQIIWSSRFLEDVDTRRVGGKGGGGGGQKVREFSYSISLAVALCEGEVSRIGRIWADGQQLDLSGLDWRLHPGSEDQLPDPLIEAIEGPGEAPAYRGTAYVVFENLELAPYGNRIPQFNFEVFRRPAAALKSVPRPAALDIRGVALVPGTGEYALATTPVHLRQGKGRTVVANVNNDRSRPDLVVSLEQMRAELPAAAAVSLVVSWFGDDLRCGSCTLQPAVEQDKIDGRQMPWRVSGVGRSHAKTVSRLEDRPVFGGTPADASVVQAIRHMNDLGQAVMFYPFILMDILSGNGLTDPWSGSPDQPNVPWRGRITLSVAPGRAGSPDTTAQAAAEVDAFFGAAQPSDFRIESGGVAYTGPDEWSYRRFVLHYANLCAMAGGVEAFCIGSEMRALTQIRDGRDAYPAVRALMRLAADVRGVLGPDVKIGYAADWSEYFGHHPDDGSGDVFHHLDPLWAHPAVDFVGIDNYMPLSDWRDGSDHLDASFGAIYDLTYLKGNVAGGEGYDWYYPDDQARERQERAAITDGAYGEPWVFRYKDIANWWSRPHFDRVAGVRSTKSTAWSPRSKPVWFTEIGCPAVDKGANQPNVFFDPKSVESYFPYYSSGARDDFIQQRYLQATFSFWSDPFNNPVSNVYGGPMVDLDRCFVWAWDARPWPDFPDRLDTWVDGANYARGHWLNTRIGLPAVGEVVAEVCDRAGLGDVAVSDLYGCVTGYLISDIETARQSLQPLMLTFGFDSFTSEGRVSFVARNGRVAARVLESSLALSADGNAVTFTRGPNAETPGRVILGYLRGDVDYLAGAGEAVSPDAVEPDASRSSVPIVLSDEAAVATAQRWLSETRIARDTVALDLPLSRLAITPADVLAIDTAGGARLYRVDNIDDMGRRGLSAVRIEPDLYAAPLLPPSKGRSVALAPPTPAYFEFLDLPILTGAEKPHAPHIAVAKTPWAGSVAVYSSANDFGYKLDTEVRLPATLGETLEALPASSPGLWARQRLRIRLARGALQGASEADVLNGANAAALRFGGDGDWEVLQFASAELVGPNEYLLNDLLRGQAGTDAVIPAVWPEGTDFVLLDGAVVQLDQPATARGLTRHYRVGPAGRSPDDPSFEHTTFAFAGVGLRPYRPVHGSVKRSANGDLTISWIRRTREDGDSWEGVDVPLGEASERYRVTIRSGGQVIRELSAPTNQATYTSQQMTQDAVSGDLDIEIAQVSDQFGAGPSARVQASL